MTLLRRVTAAGAALAITIGWAVAVAGVAAAQGGPPPSARKVVFAAPSADSVESDPKVTFRFFLPLAFSEQLSRQTVELTIRPVGRPGAPVRQTFDLNAGGGTCQELTFADVTLPTNGPFEAVVTKPAPNDTLLSPGGPCTNAADAPRKFFMGVRPVTPTGVKAELKPPLQPAVVSWNPNPEPDVVRYRVLRAKGPDTSFQPLAETRGTTFTDVASSSGGDFTYQVVAIRRGSGKAGQPEFIESPASAPSGKVTVAATAAPGRPGGSFAGAPTFTGPRASTRSAPQSNSSPRYITPGETGFSTNLPFEGGQQEIEEPGEIAADVPQEELGSNEAQSDSRRSLALLAAGLLATVLAMHLLWVKGEVDREPLEVLTPE